MNDQKIANFVAYSTIGFLILLGIGSLIFGVSMILDLTSAQDYCESKDMEIEDIVRDGMGSGHFTCISLDEHPSGIGSMVKETGRIYFDDIKDEDK